MSRRLILPSLLLLLLPGMAPAPAVGPWPTDGWTRATPWSQGMDPRLIQEAFEYAVGKESDALVVIRNGFLVAEWYSEDWTPATRSNSFSMAKSVSSALVGMMIEDGLIASVNDPAAVYLPEWRGSMRGAITVRNLLSMDSGLRENGTVLAGLLRAADKNDYALSVGLKSRPGTDWQYQQGAVQALSSLMLRVSGQQPFDYAKQRLFDVIGMPQATWKTDDVGNTLTYSAIYATAREWAKFGYLYLRNGEWDGQQVVPDRWVRESTRRSSPTYPHYGYLWWLNNRGTLWEDVPGDAFQAEGASEQHVYVVPSLDLVVVRMGESVGNRWRDNTFLGKICQAVR